jgi:hypothetical protein
MEVLPPGNNDLDVLARARSSSTSSITSSLESTVIPPPHRVLSQHPINLHTLTAHHYKLLHHHSLVLDRPPVSHLASIPFAFSIGYCNTAHRIGRSA